ncbi:MAG TPA: hypothetical protein VGH98_13620 [Gemmatimonadaceae bacterium]|jgi:hypothetical protein
MTNNVHCGEFVERLADLLERDVDETTRASLESHALACSDCGPLLADLRKLRIDASSLPVLSPTRDLWEDISQRIDAPIIPLRGDAADRSRRPTRWPRWASMAAAAILLIALTSTATYLVTVRQASTASTGSPARVAGRNLDSTESPARAEGQHPVVAVATRPDSGQTSATPTEPATAGGTPVRFAKNKPSAEQVYSSEIARLRTIVAKRRSQLDPVTISVIERNLKVIDDAIAQCRLALGKDPASRFLMESLNNALETKVELLRTATMLPARS